MGRILSSWSSKLQVANKVREMNKKISNENWMFLERELPELVVVVVATKQKLQNEVLRGAQTFPELQVKDLEMVIEMKTPS